MLLEQKRILDGGKHARLRRLEVPDVLHVIRHGVSLSEISLMTHSDLQEDMRLVCTRAQKSLLSQSKFC